MEIYLVILNSITHNILKDINLIEEENELLSPSNYDQQRIPHCNVCLFMDVWIPCSLMAQFECLKIMLRMVHFLNLYT